MNISASTKNTTEFIALDIVCGGCANAVKKALRALPGVIEVAVDIDQKQVIVKNDEELSEETLLAALDRAGFPATIKQ